MGAAHVSSSQIAGALCVVGDVGNHCRVTLLEFDCSCWRDRERVCSLARRGLSCVVIAVDDVARCCFAIGGDTPSEDPAVSGPTVCKVRGCGVPVISITAAAWVLSRAGRMVESDRLRFVHIVSKGARKFRDQAFRLITTYSSRLRWLL